MDSDLLVFDRQVGVCFGCGGDAKPDMLMCWNDWKRVPRVVQRAVWRSNYLDHPEYEESRLAARVAVATKEGVPLSSEAVELLASYGIGPDGYPENKRRTDA